MIKNVKIMRESTVQKNARNLHRIHYTIAKLKQFPEVTHASQ